MNPSFNKVTKGLFLACGISCAYMPSAIAEEAVATDKIEKITVTSTKRTQTIQEIPMAVSAMSGEQLDNMAVNDMGDLAETIPNFFIGDGIVSTNVNMRGMGSGGDRSFEQSVGMFIDNVYQPRSRQYRSPFFDAQRVEIMRGPQAVLFGLNSTAGAVSVVTAKTNPGDEFFADITAEYETEYEGQMMSLVTGGSIGDSVGVRLAAKQSSSDSFIENDMTGMGGGVTTTENDDTLVRLSLVWEATDNLSFNAKVESIEFDAEGMSAQIFNTDDSPISDGSLDYTNSYDASLLGAHRLLDYDKPGLFQESDSVVLGFDYDFGGHTLTGTAGYTDMNYDFVIDFDTTGFAIADAAVTEEYEQTSFELRLTSPMSDTFNYIVGMYYQDSELFNRQPTILNLGIYGFAGLADASDSKFTVDAETTSVFASATWNVNDNLRVIGGGRYVTEDKELTRNDDDCFMFLVDGAVDLGPGAALCATFYGQGDINRDRTSDNFMPELVVQYDLTDDMMIYGKGSQSIKSGGFASSTSVLPEALEYDDETATTVEFGLRTSLADDRGQLFVTAFSTKYDDLQVNSFIDGADGLPQSAIRNAAEATNQGIEIETRWALGEYFDLSASVAFLDATYDSFEEGVCAPSSPEAGAGQAVCDQSDQDLAYAPETSGTVTLDFNYPMFSEINFVAGVTASYTGDHFTDSVNDELGVQDAYTKVNARLGFEAADQKWSVAVIGRNITDETTLNVNQFALGNYIGYVAAPRTVTIQGTYHFGE